MILHDEISNAMTPRTPGGLISVVLTGTERSQIRHWVWIYVAASIDDEEGVYGGADGVLPQLFSH